MVKKIISILMLLIFVMVFVKADVVFSVPQESGEIEKTFSEKEICQLMKGCWLENECYPYGYRIEGQYCGLDNDFKEKYKFERFNIINQSESDKLCKNSFECKSNFCFNGECVDKIETINEDVIRINRSDIEELRKVIESAEESMEEDYNKEVSENFFSSLIGLLKKMFGW